MVVAPTKWRVVTLASSPRVVVVAIMEGDHNFLRRHPHLEAAIDFGGGRRASSHGRWTWARGAQGKEAWRPEREKMGGSKKP